jgi:hypothetical protein
MPFKTIVSTLAVVAFATTPALAAPTPAAVTAPPGPSFNFMGPSDCARWPKTGDITSATKAVPLNWALGFLSGWAAQANVALLDLVEPEGVSTWLDTYCKANPSDMLPTAVRQLERELEAKLPPPPAPAQAEAKPAPAEKAQAPAKAAPARRRAPARPRPRQ